jgi:hypothetical protein
MAIGSSTHELDKAHPRVWVELTSDSDAVTALRAVALLRDWLEERETALVMKARVEGWTWPRVADALKRPKQVVWEQYRGVANP